MTNVSAQVGRLARPVRFERRFIAVPRRLVGSPLGRAEAASYLRAMRTLALIGLFAACSTTPVPSPAGPAPASPGPAAPLAAAHATPAAAVAGSPPAAPRPDRPDPFEDKVRPDFFDGLRGNTAALDRAIKFCEDTLAREPDHAEALVWHGASVMARAGAAFRTGDRALGTKLYQQGLGEMDRAVAIAPNELGVRIPRGAVLLTVASFVPEPEKSRLLGRGVSDYELALTRQTPYFGQLTLHAREQLLYGLTDGYATLGDAGKAASSYQRMTAAAAGSQLLPRAKARAAGQPVAGATPCEECHQRR